MFAFVYKLALYRGQKIIMSGNPNEDLSGLEVNINESINKRFKRETTYIFDERNTKAQNKFITALSHITLN